MIVSLGSANLDVQMCAERWPRGGETLLASEFLLASGGKAANVAFLARKLGAPSMLLARVGDDDLAARVLLPLDEVGVQLGAVERVPGSTTAVALIIVAKGGEKSIVLANNANDAWTDDDVLAISAIVAACVPGAVLVTDFEIPAAVAMAACRAARRERLTVIVDPSPASRVPSGALGCFDVVTPNAEEAQQLTGQRVDGVDNAFVAGDALRGMGVGSALVKLADGGVVVVTGSEREHVPPLPSRRIDTTGAGDAFAGALAVALWEGMPMLAAARFAVAASSLAVRRFGSQAAYPDRATLDAAYRDLTDAR